MSEQVNVFKAMSEGQELKRKPGRPTTKAPVGEGSQSKPDVGKTKRKPVGLRGVNVTPTREGFRRRKVNDVEDRVQMFKDGGYVPVLDKDGSVVTSRAGGGTNTVLMEIPLDIYNEDQQAKYAKWNQDAQERLTPRDGRGFYKPSKKM